MSSCCNKTKTTKANCPGCDSVQKSVALETLLHHVISPLNQSIDVQTYYFCSNSKCNTVYFGGNGQQFFVDQIRGIVGQKQTSESRPICYCFDVTAQQVLDEIGETGISASKAFVIAQTKAKSCACDIRNPSGACCLADFPS